jgi:hypothetical protein
VGRTDPRVAVAALDRVRRMSHRTRAFVIVIAALIGLAANVIEASTDGASAWNIVAIVCFAVMLFAGFEMIAKTPPTE